MNDLSAPNDVAAGRTTEIASAIVDSPCGALLLRADTTHLLELRFDPGHVPGTRPAAEHPVLALAAAQLAEYFRGERRTFGLPLRPRGTTFQTAVWWALADIPYGTTATYGEIAGRVGRPTAVRAVGAANGANPLAIVLPCHRVIGANRTLTGYGGGLDRKRLLLDLESGSATLPV